MLPKNKNVALITGAAGTIGRELCRKFCQLGYFIVAIDIKTIDPLIFTHDLEIDMSSFFSIQCDITDTQALSKSLKDIEGHYGEILVIINNAGGPKSNKISETTIEMWLEDINLNLNSVFFLCSMLLPKMQKQKKGNIINIGSINGDVVYGHPGYSAAKAGLIQLTRFIAVEYGKYGIRSNIISPGTVRTSAWKDRLEKNPDLFEKLQTLFPTKHISEPSEIANLAAFLTSVHAVNINGSCITIDGGLTSGIPYIAEMFSQTNF